MTECSFLDEISLSFQLHTTLSSRLCQLSSPLTKMSMQWDSVDRIPAVVALNVMASPLKSMPVEALRLSTGNTEGN